MATRLPVHDQVSAGGVAYRHGDTGVEVALIAVGRPLRWQLPKGLIGRGEEPLAAALREVREETGLTTRQEAPLPVIEYWYVGSRGGSRVRFHKRVHFFLLAYQSGHVSDHDHEVEEARWIPLEEAANLLAFRGERQVLAAARATLTQLQAEAAGPA